MNRLLKIYEKFTIALVFITFVVPLYIAPLSMIVGFDYAKWLTHDFYFWFIDTRDKFVEVSPGLYFLCILLYMVLLVTGIAFLFEKYLEKDPN